MTVEQFLELPEEEGVRRELIAGEVVRIACGQQPHEIVKSNFNQQLAACLAHKSIGWVMSETSFLLGSHDAVITDSSVVLKGRLQPGHAGWITICPDIPIEVVSSESASVMRAKVRLYLEHGARAVWVAYPELRMIQVYTAAGVQELTGDEALEAPEIPPGFKVAAAAFFEGL